MKALWLYTHTHTHTHTGVLENKNKKAKRKNVEISRVRIKRELNSRSIKKAIKEDGINKSNIEIAIKENNYKKNNKERGITLIALIVTMITLLVLAGISISMLTGENSIVKNAQKAKVETEKAEVEEKVKLAVMGAYNNKGKFDVELLKAELNSMGVSYSEAGSEFLIELPNGKQIMVSKTTGDIREGVHKIAYNYNGGDDIGQVPNDDTEYKEGENITIKFSPVGEREGFEFLGWSTVAGAIEAEYTSTGTNTIKMEKRSITLYAVWRGIPHTISYNANTGTGAVPTAGTGIKGQNVTVNFTPLPTKTGYTFVGWSEDKTSNKAEYTADGTTKIKMPARNVTLYAKWMANSNTTYTVKHYKMDTNGNYPTTETEIESSTYTNGTTDEKLIVANLKENYEGFTYKYGQVNETTVEETTVLGDGSRVIKLYYERNKYKITYVGNGGSTPTAIEANYGAPISMTAISSRTGGYKFDGWYTQVSGGTKVNHTTMPVNGATVYAHWTYLLNTVGNEVTVGGEQFYVIEANPESSTADVKLLSKFNLNQAGNTQQNAGYATTACKFSNSNYWNANSKDLNYDHADAIAYKRAKSYGTTKGGIGRLLTYDEANSLKTSMSDKLFGKNIGTIDNYLKYWLGTSHSSLGTEGGTWSITGNEDALYSGDVSVGDAYGVRAVLAVSKSKIS